MGAWFLLVPKIIECKDGCGYYLIYQFNGDFFISLDVCAYKSGLK
jgi:hypothetical protein